MQHQIASIIKRDGKIEPFDSKKITIAISKAAKEVKENSSNMPEEVTRKVLEVLQQKFQPPRLPQVEEVQDIVEEVLISCNYPKVAKAYIIYRHERKKQRAQPVSTPDFKKPCANAITDIIKRDGTVVSFDQRKITVAIHKAAGAVGIHDEPMCERLSNEVVWYLNQNFTKDKIMPAVEEIQDVVEGVLIKNGLVSIAKSYILYRDLRARNRLQAQHRKAEEQGSIPYKKIWETLNWNVEHECETVDKLNKHIWNGTIKDLIAEAEKAYHEDVTKASQAILERKNEIRLVIIAGPSSSGKTTSTIKLAENLRKEGLKLIALNVDNYFYNLECQPKDEFGDYDFETPEALDIPLINQHLRDLLDYKPVQIPRYDFKTGKRCSETDAFQIKEGEIILIDTLHGLHGPMTLSIPENCKFKLYIETLSQLKDKSGQFSKWTDIRLLRRMVRDNRQRAYDPRRTLEHWHYVRRSELKHIIPYIPTVDYIVNGSMCYELPVLKKYLFHFFPEFVKKYENDPAHQDAYTRSKRVFELLNSIETLQNDDELVPKKSVLREFIGGSEYTYHV